MSLRTGGIGEAVPADLPERDYILDLIAGPTLLGRTATLADVGNVAAFVVSDRAASITGAAINISCGAMFD